MLPYWELLASQFGVGPGEVSSVEEVSETTVELFLGVVTEYAARLLSFVYALY